VRGNYLSPTDLFTTYNPDAVANGATGLTQFTLPTPATIKEIEAYFWNNGQGEPPGTITLTSIAAPVFVNRTFQAFGEPGSFGVQNANWVAPVNLTLPAGVYGIGVSNPSVWSQNALSNGHGFATVRGTLLSPATVIVPPPPPPPPPVVVPPPPSPFPPPCNASSGASVELAQPGCSGPVGTTLTFVALRGLAIGESMGAIQFKPAPPSMCRVHASTPPALAQVTVLPGPAGTNGLVTTSGTGLSAGSTFTTPAPAGLCIGGRGDWTWEIFRLSPSAAGLTRTGVIDCFTVACP
jgi:hypothetical protein